MCKWFIVERIDHAIRNERSFKGVKRKVGTDENEVYAQRIKEDNVTTNIDKLREELCRQL